jgi:predicted DsbA family dithiol-disulfide isomerase
MAIYSDRVTADVIECTEFPELAQRYRVRSVPQIVMNEHVQFLGAQPEPVFLDAVLRAAEPVA